MRQHVPNHSWLHGLIRGASVLVISAAMLLAGNAFVLAQDTAPQSSTIPPEQLDALVAPIAIYPDNLLAQVLVASTYPLEIVQLNQWLQKNPDLVKDQKKLTAAVSKQPWDASIQAMAALPDVVKWLSEDIAWTTDLGNAFLAQQKDVMDAVQRMRNKAQDKGTLKSNESMKVETQTVENEQVIVIQQANPQVIQVPQYDPVVVYGASYPAYPYPPVYYPPYVGGAYPWGAAAIGFGVGMAMGAAWGGGWGWGCGWGGGDVDINMNNNFNRNTNIQGGNRVNNIGSGNNKWQHNSAHRGGAPYGDRRTADRFGGTTRGDSLTNRQNRARNDLGQRGQGVGGRDLGQRGQGVGGRDVGQRGQGVGGRDGVGGRNDVGGRDNRGNVGDRGNTGNRAGVTDRSSGNRTGDRSSGLSGGNRPSTTDRSSGLSGGNRSSGLGGSSSNRGSSSIGSRDMGGSSRSSGFGGGSSGWGGSSARSSSSRGSSSMGSSRSGGSFGGGSRSSGGFSGGSRGGGGGGRSGGGGRRR